MKENQVSWGVYWAGIAFIGTCLFLGTQGCNSGSEIPIDPIPTCVELVTDDCVPEVIAEFCEECTSETDISLRERRAYLRGFDDGFERGVESVVCETTDPVCEDDIDEDCEDDRHKNAHKRCRGKGHHSALFDDDCGDDPICPEPKLAEYAPVNFGSTTCRTTCFYDPMTGTKDCVTICDDEETYV